MLQESGALLGRTGLRLWKPSDDGWPTGFEDLGAAQPQRLWKVCAEEQGKTEWSDRRCIAVVGSRKASVWGKACAREIGESLSHSGICVISGLARGIDAAALRGSLRGPIPPIAILGNGLPQIYPPENRRLAQEIVSAGGLLVSEYSPETPPRGYHFPQRNRLISAWSEAVVVVEATCRSGSLGTAHRAQEMGRTVLTFPGSVVDGGHAGCHSLIRDGALLMESVAEVQEWVITGRDSGHFLAQERRLRKLWKACGWKRKGASPPEMQKLEEIQRQTGWSAAFLLQVWWRWQECHAKDDPLDQGQV